MIWYFAAALAAITLLLWVGVIWTLRTFPVAPPMALFPTTPRHHPMVKDLDSVPKHLTYSSAYSPLKIIEDARSFENLMFFGTVDVRSPQ